MRLVHEAICRERPGLSRGEQPPDYETVRAFLNSLPRPLVTLAHEGPEKYHSKHSPFMQRGPQPVMDWWIADHRVHDVLKRNTLFAHLKDGQAFRLWLTAIYDWGSHKIVGYCFAPTPSFDTINSALRMALSQYGFPERFYWDNGKDFKKVRENLKEMRLTGRAEYLLQHQNVEFGVTSALPKHPRSKPIEAYFTRIARRFDPIWRPAYLGNRPENCPADCRQAQKQHEEYLRGKRDKSPLPTDAEFILAAVQWIEEYNGTRLDALDGQTPNEVFDAALPEARRQPIERRALDALLSDPIPRTVLAGGCVEIERVRYEPVDSLSLGPLSLQQGRKIHVLRDPYNLAEAVAVDPETHEFIGELRPQGFVDQDPNSQITKDMIRAEMRKQRSLKRAYSDWLGMLGVVASARGWKTERHALMERAGLRTGTDDRPALPEGAAPGARQPGQLAPAPRIKPGSTFISDAVAEDAALWANIEQGGPHVPDSPFVDDAAARCIAAMKEEDA